MAKSKKKEALSALSNLIQRSNQNKTLLPNDGTALSLGEILSSLDLSWNHFRRYPEMRATLEDYAIKNSLLCSRQGRVEETSTPDKTERTGMVPEKLLRDTQRRLADADRRCAELRAENASLRTKLARTPHIEALISKGGRFTA
jgi:hypothetical protein